MVHGSFTGIRIGLSTIKAFCDVKNKPCIAVSSLEALAYTVSENDCYICSMIDAKHSNFYSAIFEKDNQILTKCNDFSFGNIENLLLVLGSLKKKIEDNVQKENIVKIKDFSFSTIDNLLLVLGSLKKKIFFVGNCGILYKDVIKLHLNNEIYFESDSLVSSKYIGIAAFDKFSKGEICTSKNLTALYLKRSSAEENL